MKDFSVELIILVIIILVFISGASFLKSQFLNPDYLFNEGSSLSVQLFDKIVNPKTISLSRSILFLLTAFFFTIITYCVVRMFEIRKKEHAHLEQEIREYAHHQAERETQLQEGMDVSKNERWNKTLVYLFSESSSDWKLAVIEADAILESLMTELGFKGENLGEKLKSANQEDFRNLTTAWEVHTVRNRIAHEGLSFNLSQHEAKRVIALYERIFRQYGYI